MANITCQMLINGVQATQLNDADKVTWTETLMTSALNQALIMLALVRPDATAKVFSLNCSEGTRQNLPSDGLKLLNVVRNIKPDGSVGRAIRLVNISDHDSINPDWHSEPPKEIAKEYMFDERTPKHFYVYPPVTAATKIEIEYSAQPPEIKDLSQEFPVDMTYMQVVQEFILYKLLSGEGGQGQGNQHLQTGLALLGAKPNIDSYLSPNKEAAKG